MADKDEEEVFNPLTPIGPGGNDYGREKKPRKKRRLENINRGEIV